MTEWDRSADLVIVGSGGGGLVAALVAAESGADVLLLEKQPKLGGSTAMSGGVIWMPDNPLMRAEGVPDSHAEGMAYLAHVVGDAGPASSLERRDAFLSHGPQMISQLQDLGIPFVRCPGYSDYYPDHKGGNAAGRSIECPPFDAHELGEWQDAVVPGMAEGIGFAVKTNEVRAVSHYNRSLATFLITARVVMRTAIGRLRRQKLLTNGASLIARMLKVALDRNVGVWTHTAVADLVLEDGRVVGVRASRNGASVAIEARRAVLLCAGGFAHNAGMRRRYSGDQPNDARWTAANPGDTGEVLEAAIRLGAKADLLDEAWWLPATVELADPTGASLSLARQRPGAILVDAAGERFVNESNSYVEVGKAMYARDKHSRAVPCWLIVDDGYRRRYAHTKSRPGVFPREWLDSGALRTASTLEDLARQCGIDPGGLLATVERFNTHAEKGIDPDFGRGQSAYNRCLGDPGHRPNPCLGPIARPPYYAAEVVPSDVGTCGGLLTDEHGRVLDGDDRPIPGLYATGNITATVMGRTYPGAGASIANTMAFGYAAARHALGSG